MDELQKLEMLLGDLDYDQGRVAHTRQQAVLLVAIAQVKATKENTLALHAIAASLAQLVDLLKADKK